MSVLLDLADAAHWLDAPQSWTCWSCGLPLELPLVVWHAESLLTLHADCAAQLGAHLLMDSREAQLAGKPEPHWSRRAVAVVRHRLRAQERAA